MWRHNETLRIIAEIAKTYCETANKISCKKQVYSLLKKETF